MSDIAHEEIKQEVGEGKENEAKPKKHRRKRRLVKRKYKTTLMLDEDTIFLLDLALSKGRQYKSFIANEAIKEYCKSILSDAVIERHNKKDRAH
ncbi:hypothetical protein [Paenibacillus lactis]|uniref:hypothetical protein n=1 Tax=Paenibacillus lactis TaxID=228574 RepID=UPI001B2AD4C9|nr:hypothetical protein [Paenibacillus lactis]GIO93554.1 hypothetical protein J31TS3_47810 [Paenibacillus lactis]